MCMWTINFNGIAINNEQYDRACEFMHIYTCGFGNLCRGTDDPRGVHCGQLPYFCFYIYMIDFYII